jgi:hypothetical protein
MGDHVVLGDGTEPEHLPHPEERRSPLRREAFHHRELRTGEHQAGAPRPVGEGLERATHAVRADLGDLLELVEHQRRPPPIAHILE